VKKSLLLLPVALIAMAMALTACGGGSSSSGGGDEAAIEEAIETSATSSDPSKCTEVQTEAFNEAESGKTGEAALQECEKQAKTESEPAESVTVSNISEDGDTATAEVAITGGSLEGQAVEVGLTNEEGDWKLNEFVGFTKYDPAGIASLVEEKLGEEGGASAAIAKCVAEGIEEMSEEEAESFVFEKDDEGIEEIATACSE
jgi:ABC-type glycerol-3-phosphate transport system substrate-binding protein